MWGARGIKVAGVAKWSALGLDGVGRECCRSLPYRMQLIAAAMAVSTTCCRILSHASKPYMAANLGPSSLESVAGESFLAEEGSELPLAIPERSSHTERAGDVAPANDRGDQGPGSDSSRDGGDGGDQHGGGGGNGDSGGMAACECVEVSSSCSASSPRGDAALAVETLVTSKDFQQES
eukprot:6194677-Pleurochrysis_carterae.AAC.2